MKLSIPIFCTFLFTAALVLISGQARSSATDDIDFRRDVAPILQTRCLNCHNERDRRGGLSLQSGSSVRAGGESGAILTPGDVDSSYLLDLILPEDGSAEMPKGEAPLIASEISILQKWIKSGATWPDEVVLEPPILWSLEPIQRPDVPENGGVADHFSIQNPIDAFVAARHAEAELTPAGQADRRTLIRRLYFDLTGLPPTPDKVDSFVQNTKPSAYEQLVDEILSSPHFGEQWGRHWLDLARYADSEGYLGDSERPHAWVYREWVINAINQDLPFDQFTIEQLAGDLLSAPTLEQKIATGFHRNTLRNTEAGVDLELYRTKEIVDRVNTTGMVWLGLTLGCAECHDHKNDPISQKEFYQVYAFFNNADDVGVMATRPWQTAAHDEAMQLWQPQWDELLLELKPFETEGLSAEQKADLAKQLEKVSSSTDINRFEKFYRAKVSEWKELKVRLDAQLKQKPVAPSTKARAFAERRKDRRETFVHVRGVYNRPGEKVTLGTPAVLPPLQARGIVPDRFDLARWLFDEQNPLTARVAVNRIWQQLFGQGLVATPNDFGTQGAMPTHPALLDWLATEYRRMGWSRKAMIRLIVMSSTYRLSSASNSVPEQQLAGNQLLWRQNSYRVGAESVRDLHLAASGLLDRTIGRKGIRPPLPAFVTEVGRSVKWPVSQGSERYRRGMYIFFKRTVPYPMLMTFDAPDATVSCSRRERSNTPLQALTLLNDPVFFECAQRLGGEAARQFTDSPKEGIRMVFRRCLGRPPLESELTYLTAAHNEVLQLMGSEKTKTGSENQSAALIAVARIVMNLDEFVTRD
ncbi:MAG: PSD1 and planctomycete cytochrome C domain-containing protein [Fuerstiella sp.]|nr:PSD1 and planctomycete cytochrome C domain-containing protein [Fuerstiella sp.]